ncbi:MAG TPA: sugar isomerase [Actinophytocola sp.]|uniref:SIS domain-containing protein n=1 Tax=Actinophytocola sp. TaxID=1872138 RepID=UPI002DB5B645|nr:sugar isomerase [Actinophytocola sp.]HEU5475021.1 sugar isomerase [Actinophytocola sp.]
MSHLSQEIATQPECWRRAAALAASPDLPRPGERVAVIGCGTSYYMAMAYIALRERAGLGETDAWPASEFPAGRRYDRVVALSRSGTTTEVLDLLSRVGSPSVAITADPAAPIARVAGAVIACEFADEASVVQTRFATTALVLLRAHLGEDTAALPDAARRALAAPLPAAEQITFLGTGWTVGLAHEAALKLREAAGFWTESYPAMEYRHGPIAVAAPGRLVWIFGVPPAGLVDQIRATGAEVTTSPEDPLADLVRVHRLAESLAVERGLDPDHPRHLTRSVLLEQGNRGT